MRNVLQTKIHFESISHRWTVIWREKQRHESDILVPQCTCAQHTHVPPPIFPNITSSPTPTCMTSRFWGERFMGAWSTSGSCLTYLTPLDSCPTTDLLTTPTCPPKHLSDMWVLGRKVCWGQVSVRDKRAWGTSFTSEQGGMSVSETCKLGNKCV